jgi:integrase
VRFDATPGPGHLHGEPRGVASDLHAAKNATTGTVRNHGANSTKRRGLDFGAGVQARRLFVPESAACVGAPVDTPVRPHRSSLGRFDWTGRRGVRHSHDAPNESIVDLSATKNLRAVQLLLGHTKLESTVRYRGIEVDDALEMAEQTEV